MADEDDFQFDFEGKLQQQPAQGNIARPGGPGGPPPRIPPGAYVGQSLGNFKRNYRQTVCTYWLKGLCMKGDQCGFLHQFEQSRMPVCRNLLKFGSCKEPDCPYKHSMDEIKECNMYRLGFCVYGPHCRYKHSRLPGPPPDPETLEAAKPREARDINVVVNTVNKGITADRDRVGGRSRPAGGMSQRQLQGPAREPAPQELADRPFQGPPPPYPPPGGPPGKLGTHAGFMGATVPQGYANGY